MTSPTVVAPLLDPILYPSAAILPLIEAAAAADPHLQFRESGAGINLVLAAPERAEGERCMSELLTRLTEAAMEAQLLIERAVPVARHSDP